LLGSGVLLGGRLFGVRPCYWSLAAAGVAVGVLQLRLFCWYSVAAAAVFLMQ